MRKLLVAVAVLVGLIVLVGPSVLVRLAVPVINPVIEQTGTPTAEALELHATLDVADLHGDVLMWDRGFMTRQSIGHLDLPRMVDGRVAIQLFTAPIKVPAGMNIEANPSDSDMLTSATVMQGWPPRTWTSLTERAVHQARKLHDASRRSNGQLRVVTSRAELEAFLQLRDRDDTVVAGLLGIEGAHALEGDLLALDRVHAHGFRMIGLTHFFDNEVGGSAHGEAKGGLTDFGRLAVARMEQLGIAVDLAHASPALIDDVLAVATKPVIVSHGGVRGTCDNGRNIDDERLRGIAETGGVIGIGLWPTAVCGETPDAWADAVVHVAGLVGVEHVGLGSDWDGGVTAIVDAAGTAHLTQALLDHGFSASEIRAVMGGNVVRVLRETLPIAP